MSNEQKINPITAQAHLHRVIMNAPLSHTERQEALIYLQSLVDRVEGVEGAKEQIAKITNKVNGLKDEKTA